MMAVCVGDVVPDGVCDDGDALGGAQLYWSVSLTSPHPQHWHHLNYKTTARNIHMDKKKKRFYACCFIFFVFPEKILRRLAFFIWFNKLYFFCAE